MKVGDTVEVKHDAYADYEGHRGRILFLNGPAPYPITVDFEDRGQVLFAENELTLIEEATDNVNHPSHYTSHPSGVECITIVRHYNFNVGGAIKYLWRNGLKDEDAQVEDLQKAVWLIQDEIKRLQETARK